MVERDKSEANRLTRDHDQTQDSNPVTDPYWALFRAQLFKELNPRSLKDRILAEGIENIAQRAFYIGHNCGLSDGGKTAYDYMLHHIASIKAESDVREVAILTTLEAVILRNKKFSAD